MRIAPLLGFALLGACATTPIAPIEAPPPPPPPGMELLLGQAVETAIALLGQPRLDKREGDARLLQFAGSCILDVWYYPQPGTVPVAKHADARLPTGPDFAAGECFQKLVRDREAARAAAARPAAPPDTATQAAKTARKRS